MKHIERGAREKGLLERDLRKRETCEREREKESALRDRQREINRERET